MVLDRMKYMYTYIYTIGGRSTTTIGRAICFRCGGGFVLLSRCCCGCCGVCFYFFGRRLVVRRVIGGIISATSIDGGVLIAATAVIQIHSANDIGRICEWFVGACIAFCGRL